MNTDEEVVICKVANGFIVHPRSHNMDRAPMGLIHVFPSVEAMTHYLKQIFKEGK